MGKDAAPKEVKIAVDLPEFDPISPAQEKLVEEFTNKHREASYSDPVQRRFAQHYDDNWRNMAYKFLVSRKWNVKDASDMYNYSMKFRGRMRFHERPVWPPAVTIRGYDLDDVQRELGEQTRPDAYAKNAETNDYKHEWDRFYKSSLSEIHQKSIHYWDKTGHPVIIEVIPGKHKEYMQTFKSLLEPSRMVVEAWEDYYWHFSEVASCITRYQHRKRSAEFGRDITSVTVVLDCAHLSYGILFSEFHKLTEKVWGEDPKIVPEGLHRVFLVNSPGLITFAYSVLKHIVPKRTQEKVVICGKDTTKATLTKVIDEDKLPTSLGGTCQCPGGCF